MSLQGKNPLPGHPKTLRDLTHISEVLTLPSAFGAIQLGETFSSCLSVNNEASQSIAGVTLRVEMQTATTKTMLAEYVDHQLNEGDILEKVIHHEIKELGQHVLACTVSYRLPAGHHPSHTANDQEDPHVQSFRKFYKFAVSKTGLLCILDLYRSWLIGHKSTVSQDKSARSSLSHSSGFSDRTRESVP